MNVQVEEKEFWKQCTDGEHEALEKLTTLYGRPVYGFLFSLFGGDDDCFQDIMAKAFVEALKGKRILRKRGAFLVRVIRSVILQAGRRRELKKYPNRDRMRDSGPSDGGVMKNPRLVLMQESLLRLSWNERILLLLRDVLFFTHREMSSVLSIPKRDLKDRLMRTRMKFRNGLNQLMAEKRTQNP